MILDIEQLEIEGRRVFIRVDFNVPMQEGVITDFERIEATLPTIKHAISRNAHVMLLSHLGRPKGTADAQYSLRPIARVLSNMLSMPIKLAPDVVGPRVKAMVQNLGPGEILLLENLRFHPGEEKNDPALAKELASYGDVYINDAFGVSHRKHASMSALPLACSDVGAGFLVMKELTYLRDRIKNPQRPLTVIFGGAKVPEKIPAIMAMMGTAQNILIGGAMAYTFLAAKGVKVGNSRVETDQFQTALDIMVEATRRGVNLVLPVDHVSALRFSANAREHVVASPQIPEGEMGLDIGPKTVETFTRIIAASQTILWNGPMGVFEWERFANGTISVAQAVAANRGTTVIGGGDSIAACKKAGVLRQLSHVSTGGGAMLDLLAGRSMPGIEAIERR